MNDHVHWDPDAIAHPREAPALADLLADRFEELAGQRAIHVDGRWYSYAELGREVYRTANALAEAGAWPGAHVGVMLPNSSRFVFSWLGLAFLNATMVPINVQLVGEGLRDILQSADLDLLVTDQHHVEAAREACAGTREAPRFLVHGGHEARDFSRDVERASDSSPPAAPASPGDDALVIFTSGTTGPSKGVVLSRLAQFWHGANYFRDFIRLPPGECGYTPLPLFHVSAQGFALGCLMGGAAVVIGDRFHPFSFWRTLGEHNVRAFNYVSAMIPLLYRRPSRPDDAAQPALRAVGSATPPELHEMFERRFGIQLIETYGQTETAGLWLTDPPEGRSIGRAGKPRRWMQATVVREDRSRAEPGEAGEIALRPTDPLLMAQRYYNNEPATARAFRDGWYYAGDAGEQDETGSIRFVGRLKDFIRRRGENISAFEIERAALSHPAVLEAAAVGVSSPLGEDDVKLAVIAGPGSGLTGADLDAHLRSRLARYMWPEYIEFRQDFPRTPTQRVQKHRLTEEGTPGATWRRSARSGKEQAH